MTLFRRMAIASTLATLVLVAIGGLVRSTKSGLGCGTDWPHCNGSLTPALESRAVIIELSHRLAAAIVVVLLGTLAVIAVRSFRDVPRLMWASIGAFGLVLFQAVLGAVVVKLELEALSVVLHLAVAMSLLALLIYITVAVHSHQRLLRMEPDERLSKTAFVMAGSVLALLAVGSYVSAFPDRPPAWPLIDNRIIPDLSNEVFAWHLVHRGLAVLVGVALLVFGLRVSRSKVSHPIAARCAHIALGTFAVEVLVGAANVWTNLNAGIVTLHLLFGAVIWGSLIAMGMATRPQLASVEAIEATRRPEMALGGRST